MRAMLILNPTAGASQMATHQVDPEKSEDAIVSALLLVGIEAEVRYTTEEDPGKGLAQHAVEQGCEMVIVAGGDGTIHAVASGLIGTECTLGIIPWGTMNNIARSLHISEKLDEACRIIAEGRTSQIDIGRVNDHVFLEVAGIGLEAALFPAAEEIKRSGWVSTVDGIMKGLRTLLTFRPTKFSISFDYRRRRSYNAVQISVCNSPYYGAHLQFAPNALMDDGLLDALIYTNFSKLQYLRHAISISQGRRDPELKLTRRKIKTIRIESAEPIVVHADGVLIGSTPATISVVPGALHVRVPTHVATGPNVTRPEQAQTKHHRRARSQQYTDEYMDALKQ